MRRVPLQKRASKHPRECLLYYPYLFSDWNIKYKRFIGKKKTDRRFLMTNLVKGETALLDHRLQTEDSEIDYEIILPTKWDTNTALVEGREFLRRHYVHKVRSWSVPVIAQLDSYLVHLPYEIYYEEGKKRPHLVLYESISGSMDRVDRYPEIQQFLKKRSV